MILTPVPNTFTPDEADAMAKKIQGDDPEWTYKAKHDPNGFGYSLVEIFDEDNQFMGYL